MAERWLAGLDLLDDHERHRELLTRARALDEAGRQALADTLASGGSSHRRLGLRLAQLRRDEPAMWRALRDPSLSLRRGAASLLGRYAAQIPDEVLDELDPATLGVLLRRVVRGNRTEIADRLVDALLRRDRIQEAALVLPACSSARVVERLQGVAWPEVVWLRLAKHRADALVAFVEQQFAGASERPEWVWRRFAHVWCALSERRPDAVAGWLERFAAPHSLPADVLPGLAALVRADPARVMRMLVPRVAWLGRLGGRQPWWTALARRWPRVETEVDATVRASWMAEALRVAPQRFAELLSEAPYPRRAAWFEQAAAALDTAAIEWPATLLAVLPEAPRDREAARMATLRRAQEDPSWRRQWLGYRAVEAVRSELEAHGRAAQASDRAEAHAALVRATTRSRRGMEATLAWLQCIRNDQDPVRLAVLQALAEAPAARFRGCEAALEAAIAPIFDARDTSYATRQAAAAIARRLLVDTASTPHLPQFALGLRILSRLAGQGGVVDLPPLHRGLPRGAEHAIVKVLLPWLEAEQQRDRQAEIYRVWHSLGRRAWNVEALEQLLVRAVWNGPKNQASTAAELWLQDPRTRDARVFALVERDPSALALDTVFRHAHRRRQTLLTRRFSSAVKRGRFHDGKALLLPLVTRGMERWSEPIMRLYLERLREAEAEPQRYAWSRVALVQTRARVPLTEVADLLPVLASHDVNLVEAALGAMVWTDRPAPALAVLLDHLDGDRARVAMYALPRLARLLPAAQVVDAVAALLQRPKLKVTVQKEAVRLLGQYPTPRALALLGEIWARPRHRDVKIAALHAARATLPRPESWALLRQAATDPSEDIAVALVDVPLASIAHVFRAPYLEIMSAVVDHESMVARTALMRSLAAGWITAGVEVATVAAVRVLARGHAVDPWEDAIAVLAAAAASELVRGALEALVVQLRDATVHDVEPSHEADQIPWQRLGALVERWTATHDPRATTTLRACSRALLAVPLTWSLGGRLAIAAEHDGELGEVAVRLLGAAPSFLAAWAIGGALSSATRDADRAWDEADAEAVVDALFAGPPVARTIAVRLVGEFGPRWAWRATWVERLDRARRDGDVDVQVAARNVQLRSA